MNTAEILRAAAARVRQGWGTGRLMNADGHVCALGGIACAVGLEAKISSIEEHRAYSHDGVIFTAQHVARALHLDAVLAGGILDFATEAVYQWNDAPDQTAENVAAGLEYAALLWEQEQAQSALSSDTRQLQEA